MRGGRIRKSREDGGALRLEDVGIALIAEGVTARVGRILLVKRYNVANATVR